MNYKFDRRSSVYPVWLKTLRKGWFFVAIGALLGAVIAYTLSLLVTPQYQASAALYVSSSVDENSSSSAYQGSLASEQRVASYTKLAESFVVLQQAIQAEGINLDVRAARESVTAAATPDTVLMSVRARNSDPEVAERLANGVAEALAGYVAQLETPPGGTAPVVRLSVISPASASDSPVAPQTSRYVLAGVALGVVLGLLALFVRTRFSDRIRESEDIREGVGLPVLADISADPKLRESPILDFSSGWSRSAESFRKLRTNVSFADVDNPSRIILVTSPVAGEGKTTTALNLGAVMAEAGKKVLVVDADLRRPQIGQRTMINGHVGLTDWLRGDAELSDVIVESAIENLSLLASGQCPPNPSELLDSRKLGDGLQQLSKSFDYVIIDSPPVLPVTDSVVLAKNASAVVLVVRAGESRIRNLSAALSELSMADTEVIGVVITDSKSQDKSTYYYYLGTQTPAQTKKSVRQSV